MMGFDVNAQGSSATVQLATSRCRNPSLPPKSSTVPSTPTVPSTSSADESKKFQGSLSSTKPQLSVSSAASSRPGGAATSGAHSLYSLIKKQSQSTSSPAAAVSRVKLSGSNSVTASNVSTVQVESNASKVACLMTENQRRTVTEVVDSATTAAHSTAAESIEKSATENQRRDAHTSVLSRFVSRNDARNVF